MAPAFPVYHPQYLQFYAPSELIPPAVVDYNENDPYKRDSHQTQFLAVPVDVPNYLGLCKVEGQKCWGPNDEIFPHSLQLCQIAIAIPFMGRDIVAVVYPGGHHLNKFFPTPDGSGDLKLEMSFPALSASSSFMTLTGEVMGGALSSTFRSVGYDLQFSLAIEARFNRQMGSLKVAEAGIAITSLKNLISGATVVPRRLTPEVASLLDLVGEPKVIGVRFYTEVIQHASSPLSPRSV